MNGWLQVHEFKIIMEHCPIMQDHLLLLEPVLYLTYKDVQRYKYAIQTELLVISM
jgi:hypothetical protein